MFWVIVELNDEKIGLTKDDFEIIGKEKEHVAFSETENMTLLLDISKTLGPVIISFIGYAKR